MTTLLNDQDIIERIFEHIDNKTTDLGDTLWREPVAHYSCPQHYDDEMALLRRQPVVFCPSAALPEIGSYTARTSIGTPLVAVRGADGQVRAFINSCRHRGMQVVEGSGCSKALICPYHAWTYGLDGQLKNIPGQQGFPGLDTEQHSLVEISALEHGGLVYVNQKASVTAAMLEHTPSFFSAEQRLFDQVDFSDEANWKLIAETSMEGYHIKSLHKQSFYPYGLDNINVVENFGLNSRITFPFRRIEKLREVEPAQRKIDGLVTYVYQLFPNTHVAVLSKHTNVVILEPLSPTRTQYVIYRLTNKGDNGLNDTLLEARRDASFVAESGQDEDRAAACAIQNNVTTAANSHFTFGHYEKAIVHFHQGLQKNLNADC